VSSLRLFGSLPADPGYSKIVDVDRDGLSELRVRVRFDAVAPHLSVGVNTATIVGRAGASEVQGTGTIAVLPLSTDLRVTPRTLEQRSSGEDAGADDLAEGVSAWRSRSLGPAERRGARGPRGPGTEAGTRVKFDRAPSSACCRWGLGGGAGDGTLRGLLFAGVDHIRVIE
jgi:hypothetical protein